MSRVCSQHTLEKIDAVDWREAPGITERAKLGTNSMLAERDYTVKCETGTEPIGVIGGIWVWYCFNHAQPQSRCALDVSENELKRLKTEVIETIRSSGK